jgi:autotransporter translocation and assembly factor TamB
MNARDRKIGGHLTATGNSLSIFKTQIDNFIAKLNLKATDLELEQLEIDRKKDFLRAQGKIDMSHEHNYSGTIEATVGNAAEYLSNLFGHAGIDAKPGAAEINATITSSSWDVHAIVNFTESGPVNLAAKFPLKIGQDWKAFLASPLEVTIDLPAIFLANAPQFFHPEIFSNGILSGKIYLSETLQHPRVVGDLQLLDGKLQNAPMNFTEANGRATFNGDRATIDFFNACRKDVCLSFRGEIVFQDSSNLAIRITGTEPIFDLTPRAVDCLNRVELAPVGITLAPVIRELELRGGMFSSDWTVNLKESENNQSSGAINWGEATRNLRLCFGTGAGEKSLTLGALPRPHMLKEPVRPRKRAKRH